MPVSPTYPGVYIEEIPSGVHTITGVATSITAFIGYTPRGSVNEPVHIFSFADFERAFGGLSTDSPLSYAIKQFFQNGGSEGYVVRVAQGAVAAMVALENSTTANSPVLDVAAASAGTWGNDLQIDVDYATANPASLFNFIVTEYHDENGRKVPKRTETFRNLSMNEFDANFVEAKVNAGSSLITVKRASALSLTAGQGTSESGTLTAADIAKIDATHNTLVFTLNGGAPLETPFTIPAGAFPAVLTQLATNIATAMSTKAGSMVTGSVGTNTIKFTSGLSGQRSAIHFLNASTNNATAILKLGLANGGTEIEAQAGYRPVETGTVGIVPPLTGLGATGSIQINIRSGASTTVLKNPTVQLWGAGTKYATAPATVTDLVAMLNEALKAGAVAEPMLTDANAMVIGGVIRLLPGPADPNVSFEVNSDATATALGLAGAGVVRNVARYAPGSGASVLAQLMTAPPGFDGVAPGASELTGSELNKTGIYALEKVDLFNMLVIPETADVSVQTEAIAYCTRRRAFMIVDAPETLMTAASAQAWIGSTASPLRSRNAALYFPRLREPDPMMNGVVRSFAAAGALAGIYARTDAERGVWKAPAGTSASVVGATGLSLTLTDKENGTLNPLGLNSLRTFPVYGTVSWGARTSKGADALADEYKYIPVRRLALFLEESLYRGTQWAVFEPNDEPLWAQIRLNLGAFMHTLFAQGAFQGRTPRDAYFVKCDKETTTQNDIDLGRVNIIVGFAPLKPAEFVIIQIQQIAGQIQT